MTGGDAVGKCRPCWMDPPASRALAPIVRSRESSGDKEGRTEPRGERRGHSFAVSPEGQSKIVDGELGRDRGTKRDRAAEILRGY